MADNLLEEGLEDDLNALFELFEDDEEEGLYINELPNSEIENNTIEEKEGGSRDAEPGEDISAMKAKMLEMERELKELKQKMEINNSTKNETKKQENFKNGQRKRVAHQSRGVAMPPKKIRNMGGASYDKSCDTEHFTGLRIKNPLISSQLMKERMKGRRMIRIPLLYAHIREGKGDIEGDWVTAGVIVHKLPPKDSAKGSKFSVWKLSDLSSQTAVVSLFLFDKVFEEHWKTPIGNVVAILNPKVQTDRETDSSTGLRGVRSYSLSLDNPGKLMLMGVSFDYTSCLATAKSGKPCQNFASKQYGGRCEYHLHGEYSKLRSKRMDCQGGFGPKTMDIHTKVLGKNEIFHQGRSFSAEKKRTASKRNENDEEREGSVRLFAPGAKEKSNEVESILGQELAGSCVKKFKNGVRTQSGGEIIKNLLQGQSPGAVCYQSYLKKKKEIKKETDESYTSTGRSALQMLKDHSNKIKSEFSTDTKISNIDHKNTFDHEISSNNSVTTPTSHVTTPTGHVTPPTDHVTCTNSKIKSETVKLTQSSDRDLLTKNASNISELDRPTLSFGEFDLFAPPPLKSNENKTPPTTSTRQITEDRLRITEDRPPQPVATRHLPTLKTSQSFKEREKRKKLKAKELAKETLRSGGYHQKGASKSVMTRLEKNLKEAGEVTSTKEEENKSSLDLKKLEKLLATKSAHESDVRQDELELEEAYFQHLEKKEAIEEKLSQTKELNVRVIKCLECNYVAESAGEKCRKEGHHLSRFKALKRCFQCSICNYRIFTYNERYPKISCNCGENDYKATSLYQVRKGPKLPGEELSLRGDERKFLK